MIYRPYGQTSHVPRISQEFFEGEGSFISGNTLNKPNSATNIPLWISLFQKEKRILEILQKIFGFGNLYSWEQNQQTYW